MELSKYNTILLTREGLLIFMLKKLGEIDSEIGNEMLVALRRRISERRNKDMLSLMRFLQSSSISRVDNYDEFCYSNKSETVFKGKETIQHLYYGVKSSANTNTSATNMPAANTSSVELCSIATDDVSLSNILQNAISAVSVVQTSTSRTTKEFEFGSLHKEFNLFENSGVRTPNLDMLLCALRTI
jgi:hypothetical protein